MKMYVYQLHSTQTNFSSWLSTSSTMAWPPHQRRLQYRWAVVQGILLSNQHKHTASLWNHTDPLYHLFSNRENFPQTIKVDLFVVCHMHNSAGMFTVFSQQLTPCLQLTRKGIKHSQAISHSFWLHLSITLQLLQNIHAQLSQQPHCYNNILTWAVCCLAFLNFSAWASSLTLLTLSLTGIATFLSMISPDNPQLLKVTIKQSKLTPFMQVLISTLEQWGLSYVQSKDVFHILLFVATTRVHSLF